MRSTCSWRNCVIYITCKVMLQLVVRFHLSCDLSFFNFSAEKATQNTSFETILFGFFLSVDNFDTYCNKLSILFTYYIQSCSKIPKPWNSSKKSWQIIHIECHKPDVLCDYKYLWLDIYEIFYMKIDFEKYPVYCK